ncbi:MAG TPA: AsmA family protein [Candidatus Tenderia electrophaga]|uniref:AsmA family protein n=1 Tax=Candidatus Tenderia electrophaga TaxID=1748243 RepID=A0A832J6A7_9GAMM|nr:AsmA family protein [Candidatus Tenderia electrophaga]
MQAQISSAVEETSGRQLNIEGDIGLSLFPWVGMKLGKITLSNANGFADAPFAQIESAEVKLKLLPLLKQEVEMKAITLRGLNLNLQIDAQGKTNWDDLSQSETTTTTPATPQPSPANSSSDQTSAFSLAALAIGGVEITNANISYDDRVSKARYTIKQLNLITGPVSLNKPLDISLSSQFSSNQPDISGTLELKTRITADIINGQQHRLDNTQLTLNVDSPEFASRGQLKLSSDIAIDLARQQYQLSQLVFETNLENADLPQGRLIAKLMTNINANLKQQTATLANLTLSAYDLSINANLNATKILGQPEFNGKLAIAPFNARQLLQTLGQEAPETADIETLKKVALNMEFDGTTEAIRIKPLQLQLDDSNIAGWLEADLAADQPMPGLRYALTIDDIDADRYLPPASETETTIAPPASAGAAAASTLPMELMRQLNIDGQLDIGKLKISGLHISDITTRLTAKDGQIQLLPSAKLYQGQYQGRIQVDARQDIPRFKLDESLNNIAAAPLLKDLMDDDMVSGKGSIRAKLTTMGHSPEAMTKALNGTLAINFKNGAVKDFNLAQMVREAKAKLKKQPPPAKVADKGTDFTELSATFKIINGVVHNNDLRTKAPFVRIDGKGKVDLVKEQLDYTVRAAIVKTEQGEGGAALDELKGLKVPVRITGSFAQPKFDLQYDEILKARGKEELAKAKAKLKAKLDAEKQKLAAKKAKLQTEAKRRLAAEKAAARQKLEAKKAAAQQKLDAKKEAARLKLEQEKEQLKQQAEDALKDKLKGLFK